MKLIAVLSIVFIPFTFVNAQDFSGIRMGNYSGVSGVFYNPANIADSRHRWDFSLFNLSTFVGNNKASFKLSDIGSSFDADSIKNTVFSENSGPSSGFGFCCGKWPLFVF